MAIDWFRIRMAAVILLALVALASCTLVRMGYTQLDTFAAWTANDYFDLDTDQRQEFARRFDGLYRWHRYEQLPEYVAFLDATRARVQNGLGREDVQWVFEGVRSRYRSLVRRGAEDAAAMLMTVTPAQIDALKRRWDRDNRRFVREYRLEDGQQEQREVRLKRVYTRISDWTGSLSSEQEAKIAAIIGEGPSIHRLRYEDRLRRQREFLQLMAERGEPRRFAERLRHWLANWEEKRDPEYDRVFRDWEQRQTDLYVAVARMLTPQQRAAVLRRIQGYMDDFTRLAERPDARTSASR